MSGRHPAWCRGGRGCDTWKTATDGTLERSHGKVVFARGGADVFLSRIEAITPQGEHTVTSAIVLSADVALNAHQAAQLGAVLLLASHELMEGSW